MNALQTLTIAVLTGLSLGVGAATVQESGSVLSLAANGSYTATRTPGAGKAQSGSSGLDTVHPESPGVHTDLFAF